MQSSVSSTAQVVIELYGVPRMWAGQPEWAVDAATVADAIAALERLCPALSGSVIADGWLLPAYRVSLNGCIFLDDPSTSLKLGDRLVLIAADAGG